ncbi:MAG: DUF4394 domain-containing protein [Chloroflexaceae bacterium]|nr:DUF4394 domain-containing protein [Chloroflexaceae bacterium]
MYRAIVAARWAVYLSWSVVGLLLVSLALAPLPSIAAPRMATLPHQVYAVTSSGQLLQFTSAAPERVQKLPISGLQPDERLIGIDVRPATGVLFGVSNRSRVYTLNTQNGLASPVGNGQLFSPALDGQSFGLDFNPVPDRIRLVSIAGQNLRLNPDTGAVAASDPRLAYAPGDVNVGKTPAIVGAGYTNNQGGATVATVYVIDVNQNTLATLGSVNGSPVSPNTGQLFTVGSLGVDASELTGIDVAQSGIAFAAIATPGSRSSGLFTLNLGSGQASQIGTIGGGEPVVDLAVEALQPRPDPRQTVIALSESNKLLLFSSVAPGAILRQQQVTGLQPGEKLVGLDFRATDGKLYAVGSSSLLYMVDLRSGQATLVGNGQPFSPLLEGQAFGMDFNPVPDRIRFVSNLGQNLRLNPDTGAVAANDGRLAYAAGDANAGRTPAVVGAGYTNNRVGATMTTVYVIDTAQDVLVTLGSPNGSPVSPNTGQLFTVGSLGLNAATACGSSGPI